MRVKSVTERYRAVSEGTMTKKEFVRQMRQQYPMHITQFNGYDDSVQILKNRGLLFETKVEKAKVYDERPALTYSLDALDRGIRAELGNNTSPTPEEFKTAQKKAKDNLEKNPTHYLDLMSGESNKVDKHDREVEVKRGKGEVDVFNGMKKAALKEGYTEEQISDAIQKIKERKAGEPIIVDGEVLTFRDAVQALVELIGDLKSRMYSPEEMVDFVKTEEPYLLRQDVLDAAAKRYPKSFAPFISQLQLTKEIEEKSPVNKAGEHEDGTPKSNDEMGDDEREDFYNDLDDVNEEPLEEKSPVNKAGLMGQAIQAIKAQYGEVSGISGIIRDFLTTHADDIFADPNMDYVAEFDEYVSVNYDSLSEKKGKDHDGDGDIDGDDYMAAKDKAIKGAMGKEVDEIGMFHDPVGYNKNADSEDKQALDFIAAMIEKGIDKETAIEKASDKFGIRTSYLQRKMGIDESAQLKEAVKSIIRRVLTEESINEAATGNLSKIADDYDGFQGMQNAVNQLENIVTDVESYYSKVREKIQKVYGDLGNITNEEGLKVGGFLAPAIEAAFMRDLKPVIGKGFTKGLEMPKVKVLSKSDIEAHNSGERPLGEEGMEKRTMFSPVYESKTVTEAINKDLETFGKEIAQSLEKTGHSVKLVRGHVEKNIKDAIGQNAKLAALAIDQYGDSLEIFVSIEKKDILAGIVKKYNLTVDTTTSKSAGWDDKEISRLNKGDLYIAMPSEPVVRQGDVAMTRIGRFNPDSKLK